MISDKLVNFSKTKNWWFDDVDVNYINALISLGVELDSDLSLFFLHIEDGPSFFNGKTEIYHLAWHVINTDYLNNLVNIRKVFDLPSSYILLNSLEGGEGFFYDIDTKKIICYSQREGEFTVNGSFNCFMEDYFDLK